MTITTQEKLKHHTWCNSSPLLPVKECSQCRRLYELYPSEDSNEDELVKLYFPDAIKRT